MKKSLIFIFLAITICIATVQVRAYSEPAVVSDNDTPASTEAREDKPVITEEKPLELQNEINKLSISAGGYFQLWYIYEDIEDGSRQEVTGDKTVQEASGFAFNHVRLNIDAFYGDVGGRVMLRLEGGSAGILDAFCYYAPFDGMVKIVAGQMKIPSTYEAMEGDDQLDFITRSTFSEEVANWSLSKSPSSVSPFTSVQTYKRDTGIAFKGTLYGTTCFFMVGNGLGANMFVGGPEKKQTLYSNKFGAYFYGFRGTFDIMDMLRQTVGIDLFVSSLALGGHYNRNNHPDSLYNDQKTVIDIDRESWSVDGGIELFKRLRLTGMYGWGIVRDDFNHDGEPDYEYSGWEIKAMVVLIQDWLEAGFRYDEYIWKKSIYAGESTAITYTVGMNFFYGSHLTVQANYKWKLARGGLTQDLNDDIFILQIQFKI